MEAKPIYKILANFVSSYKHWIVKHPDVADVFEDAIEKLVRAEFPSGSGFDSGTTLDLEKSSATKLVFLTAYHHMNDGGYYDGWSENIKVVITASLRYAFDMRVTGIRRKDRWHLQDYIVETFNYVLEKEIEYEWPFIKR